LGQRTTPLFMGLSAAGLSVRFPPIADTTRPTSVFHPKPTLGHEFTELVEVDVA
jgi:hypothetical protein